MKGKTFAPPLRRTGKVFLDECSRGGARLLAWHRVHPNSGGDVGEKMGGVADGIAQSDRVQVNEDHAVTINKNVVGLQVAMDWRGRNFFQARNDRGNDRFGLRSDFGTSPLNQSR